MCDSYKDYGLQGKIYKEGGAEALRWGGGDCAF